jgi:hypothetical protein
MTTRRPFSDPQDPVSRVSNIKGQAQSTEWRLWVTTVFLPNIQAMRDLVVKHADLLIGSTMPPLLLDLCAHVSGYEITAARWAQGHHNEHLSVVSFPQRAARRLRAPWIHDAQDGADPPVGSTATDMTHGIDICPMRALSRPGAAGEAGWPGATCRGARAQRISLCW